MLTRKAPVLGGAVIKRLYCKVVGHRVNRRRVWNDQLNFRTNCERCAVPLLRDRNGWREFDTNRDANELRDAHPRSLEPSAD
jgi:hypothetical protein